MKACKSNIYDFVLTLYTDESNDLRPVFKKPFYVGDKVYATDAHTIIRVDRNKANLDYTVNQHAPDVKPPSADSVYKDLGLTNNETLKLSDFIPKFYDCVLQIERMYEDCKECNGHGEKECDCCGNDAKCKKCDGKGVNESTESPLNKINATGENIKVFNKVFKPHLLYKIIHTALLLKEENIHILYNKDDRKCSVLFKIKDVEIIIMSVLSFQP